MYSLNDLQQNLKSLIKELKQIESTVAEPQRKRKQNSTSMLLSIPRGLLLASICSFLNMQDINYLSNTCVGLRKILYSPLGWKIIGRIKTLYPVRHISKSSEFMGRIKNSSAEASLGMDLSDYDDEKYISQERNKFKNILLAKYSAYLNSKQRFEAHRDKVRTEKGHLFKMHQQKLYLEQVRDKLDEQNKVNKEKLKILSEGFSAKMNLMDEANDALLKEKTKLQNQKEALASKVREYQHEIEVIKEDSQKSKQILRRLKNYLLYKQL